MHLRSFPHRIAGLGLAASVGLGSLAALAQQPPQAGPPPAPAAAAPAPVEALVEAPAEAPPPLRFFLGLHGGLLYRVGSVTPGDAARGGGLFGLDILLGTNKWWAAGVGFEHAFFGSTRADDKTTGAFTDTSHTLENLWALGRFYPWQNENVALYLQLGIGPSWQTANHAGVTALTGATGQVIMQPSTCNGHGSTGLGMRGSVGIDVALSNLIVFYGDLGVDHFRLQGDTIDDCAAGMGASTFLGTRFGIALSVGREPPAPPPPPPPPPDRDGDGIFDEVDACPDQPGPASDDPTRNGCPPPPDRDHDGVVDASDACPDVAGPPSDDPKKNGCPDRDGDQVIDLLDACPDLKGVPSADPKENGCPPDTDGDGIRDDKDACPTEKGIANPDPTKNGCPLVAVREKEIVITQQVQFEVDKALIKPESNELLDTVATVMKDHPELLKFEVQGHTDDTGAARRNKVLSGQRAEAVKTALLKRGIHARRLQAKGYGQDQPIADNATDEGKAKNRRVQFVILEKQGEKADADAKKPAKAPEKKPAKAPEKKPAKAPEKKPAKAPAKKK